MKYFVLPFLLLCWYSSFAQSPVTVSRIHAHNDYQKIIPFYEAYRLGVRSIEVDIFLADNELYVGHDLDDVQKKNTLDSLYLRPLQKITQQKSSLRNQKSGDALQLLVDIKSDGEKTLDFLVRKLDSYPPEVFVKNEGIKIVISGNVPPASTWQRYPSYISFDGRPETSYSAEQIKRVAMISDDFSKYTTWNGKGLIPKTERERLDALIASVHRRGKKIRFWATPDQINAWKILLAMDVDFLGTDYVSLLRDYIKKQPTREYTHTSLPHTPYEPTFLNNDKRSKVKNIILLIGDGMGLTQIYAGYTGNRGTLSLFNMINIGFSITASADSYTTDSAAGGTAMATGKKTNNRYVGLDSMGNSLPAIPQLLKKYKIASGLISAGDITDATPAAFYAHEIERTNSQSIASDFMLNPVDILIGGGRAHFTTRTDGQNLFSKLQHNGYVVGDQFGAIDTIHAKKFILLDDKAVLSKEKGRGDFLPKALAKSMSTLGENAHGFFIMAEGAQIDYGGHENKIGYVVQEMIDFDLAIGEAMRFADSNGETLVIVTADHETGGLTLLGGDIRNGYVDGSFSTPDHTAVMVPVFAYGPHSQDFRGVYQNTAIFEKIMKIFELYKK
jgi:alkaline phosphatase